MNTSSDRKLKAFYSSLLTDIPPLSGLQELSRPVRSDRLSFLTIFSGLLISSLELVFSKTVQGAKYHSKIISGFKRHGLT